VRLVVAQRVAEQDAKTKMLDYTNTLRRHVLPTVGSVELADLEASPELLDGYIGVKRREGLAPSAPRKRLRTRQR